MRKIYKLLTDSLRKTLDEMGFQNAESLLEKQKIFETVLIKYENKKDDTKKKERIQEYLRIIFEKEILTDSEREDLYVCYDLRVKRNLNLEEIKSSQIYTYLRHKYPHLCNEDMGSKSVELYQKFHKYFKGDGDTPAGLCNRLKPFIDIDKNNILYENNDEYISQGIRLFLLIFDLEHRYDLAREDEFDETEKTINLMKMLKNSTMENANLEFSDMKTRNGHIMRELQKALFMSIDSDKAFAITERINSIIYSFQLWHMRYNALIFNFQELPDDYYQKIYEALFLADEQIKETPIMEISAGESENSFLETVFLKVKLNEALGRQEDLIKNYDSIIELEKESVPNKMGQAYKTERRRVSIKDPEAINKFFRRDDNRRILYRMVYGKDELKNNEWQRFNRAKKYVDSYIDMQRQNTNNATTILVTDIASVMRLSLFKDKLRIPNKFYHAKTQDMRTIGTDFYKGTETFEKNQTACIELVRWHTLCCSGEQEKNVDFYFKSLQCIDEILKWVLSADTSGELEIRYRNANNVLIEIL